MKKIYISQPTSGREYDAIMAERKALIANAAVALRTDDLEVFGSCLGAYNEKRHLRLLAWELEKMADADAVIFAPGWKEARGCRVERLAAAEYGVPIIDGKG